MLLYRVCVDIQCVLLYRVRVDVQSVYRCTVVLMHIVCCCTACVDVYSNGEFFLYGPQQGEQVTSPGSSTPSGPPVPYRVTSDPMLKPLVYGEESVDGPDLKQRRESQAALKQMMVYGEQLVQSQVDPEAPPPIPPKRKHSEAITAMLLCVCLWPI